MVIQKTKITDANGYVNLNGIVDFKYKYVSGILDFNTNGNVTVYKTLDRWGYIGILSTELTIQFLCIL